MSGGSFIIGIIIGFILAFILIAIFIIHTFGMGFISMLPNFLDGNVSFNDLMELAKYFGVAPSGYSLSAYGYNL
jgi:hypothetical protein